MKKIIIFSVLFILNTFTIKAQFSRYRHREGQWSQPEYFNRPRIEVNIHPVIIVGNNRIRERPIIVENQRREIYPSFFRVETILLRQHRDYADYEDVIMVLSAQDNRWTRLYIPDLPSGVRITNVHYYNDNTIMIATSFPEYKNYYWTLPQNCRY